MLTALKAYSPLPAAPVLPLGKGVPDSDFFQIREIDGLGPVKASINTTPYGSIDGTAYNGSLAEQRNIVIKLGFNPDWVQFTFEELRKLLYAYFAPKMHTQLVFTSTHLPEVKIDGYVETMEPTLFAKDGETQISIICPDPYFTAVQPKIVNGLTANDNSAPVEIDYGGSTETGILVRVTDSALQMGRAETPAPDSITIQVGDPSQQTFKVDASVDASCVFITDSIPGEKYVQEVELGTGVITNLYSKVESGYKWPLLLPGPNKFQVITNQGTKDWELTYYERFVGL